ncbi:hypothetical protein BG015_005546 [Linnemannia schmuckeri]|uniref:Uncharacterized protein n=1 Tax=Linnemannia schmuckeri TaxID=64567 RepID=A0A9P5R537_9FUNG|nr:hypothetical protein BG015_005546 [Linnemannia schmuckeri]
MERVIDRDHANLDDDPAFTAQPALQHYRPTDAEVIGCPNVKPAKPVEFFTKSSRSDAELKEAIRRFPKNVYMGQYKAPKVPQVVSANLSYNKKYDGQLCEFQERCAELTRPVDFFYHQFKKLQELDPIHLEIDHILNLSMRFAIIMREQLGGMAVKIHETRMSNNREAAGANFEDNLFSMLDSQTSYDHAKSIRKLQSSFKTKTGSDNRRDKDGYGNNNNQGNSHGNYSRNNSDRNWNSSNQTQGSRNRPHRGHQEGHPH